MQDYFASTAQTDDSRVLMSLMRHTNLTTTTTYIRAVHEHMKDAVKNLGASLGATQNGSQVQKSVQKSIQSKMAELARMLTTEQNNYRKLGGGGRSRTYDAADMSRVL
jgi:ABC-type hemin transport system substrate-binding protein